MCRAIVRELMELLLALLKLPARLVERCLGLSKLRIASPQRPQNRCLATPQIEKGSDLVQKLCLGCSLAGGLRPDVAIAEELAKRLQLQRLGLDTRR